MKRIPGYVNQAQSGAADRLNQKRFAKRLARGQKVRIEALRRSSTSKRVLASLTPEGIPARFWPRGETKNSISLTQFSFLDAPEATLTKIVDIATANAIGEDYYVDFRDEYCLDIGPYMVFGLMQGEMKPICQGGKMSPRIMKVLEAVNMRRFLQMRPFPIGDTQDVWPIPLYFRASLPRYVPGFESHESAKEKVARRFSTSIDKWLFAVGFRLSIDGGDWLRTLLSEVLDNSRHANPDVADGDWSVAGFMARREREDGSEKFVCHLGIITIGITFAQSLRRTQKEKVREDISKYVSEHINYSNDYDEDALITATALTDGICCEINEKSNSIGGCGMSSLVNMMNTLGVFEQTDERPNMIIISGTSCIRLADPHNSMSRFTSEDDTTYYQAFNDEEDLAKPPDSAYVFRLRNHFPGTVISLRFTIDRRHLEKRFVS